jgi:hypothetical protein
MVDDLTKTLEMLFNGFLARLDECLETPREALARLTRLGATHLILSDVEAEEVKTCLPVHFIKGMGNAGLTRFQFETNRL